ncbi:acetyl-CoA carboxylase carboxyltransferase subunit alpha/beta [Williamsia sp. DF01-3]|uniref:acetyl-CoA carboxylase carboxyltransferase subunit alpha/beta n=1 Tax=Williamsia sp. DF01-3 TaxID=2934157 RepID=UPI001FF6548D|nr:acetyl-CoA carboxylase carboxyltransferase subunit alpha/beta [Williamsia sp. DF01-3]MCK0517589.1 acetyl-CoA carboxylase carboxyltransferase subunit alpha/beta [Williamsia sp. DF01-3]
MTDRTDRPERISATQLLAKLADEGSWHPWDSQITALPDDAGYAEDIGRAREKTGLDESIICGEADVNGVRVAVVVSEFGFLGGSIGRDAGRRVVTAIRRATAEGLPLLALPASGGTRMQEGTAAFLQMVNITAAVVDHKAAHLPYVVYLRHPTTGGVFASWGSLGHVTLAEPGALVGFLGPRVYEGLYGEAFPEGVQVSENLRSHGLVDLVVAVDGLGSTASRIIRLLVDPLVDAEHSRREPAGPSSAPGLSGATVVESSAWDVVEQSRVPGRPGVSQLLRESADEAVELAGGGELDSRSGIILALARFGGHSVVVVGQDRNRQVPGSLVGPADLRLARRGMRLAQSLHLPLVTVIDTPGADLSADAEESGLANEIAHCIAELTALTVPTVAVLLGQGAGGAALALFPADRVVAMENSWLSPLPPEGASLIVYRDTDHAADMARSQGIRATDLHAAGIVDVVVPEAALGGFLPELGDRLAAEIDALDDSTVEARAGWRTERLRRIGGVEI